MKKRILSMLLVIVMVLALVPVQALADGAGSVTVSSVSGKEELSVYGKLQLSAEVAATLPDKTVTWESSDTTVATVDANGIVTGVKAAETVTITARDVSGGSGTIDLKVVDPVEVKIVDGKKPLAPGESLTLSATYGTYSPTWQTSNAKKATVAADGVVTGVAAGSAFIYARFDNDRIAGRIKVQVETPVVVATDIELSNTSVELYVDGSETITATVTPDDAADKTLTWSSDDAEIASVDNGKITGNKAGNTTITVKCGSVEKTIAVTVKEKTPVVVEAESVTITGPSDTMPRGGQMQLSAEVLPANATNKDVAWTIAPGTAGTVDNGLVKLEPAGTVTTVTVTAKCGSVQDDYVITITDPIAVDSVTVSQAKGLKEVVAGGTLKLKATVNPSDATDQEITWSSSDKSIAKVNKNGLVTGVAASETEVTITASCGGKSGTYTLKVTPAENIVVEPELPATILAGEALPLKAVVKDAVTGETLTNAVEWKLLSEDEGIRLNGSTLETSSDLEYRHTVKLEATAVGCDAKAVEKEILVMPRTDSIVLKIGDQKVTNQVYTVNLNDPSVVENGIVVSAFVQPSMAEESVRWEITDANNLCTDLQGTSDVKITPTSALKSGTVTVKAFAGDGTGVSATTTIQFAKLGMDILVEAPTQLRGGASVNLGALVKLDKDLDDKTVVWSIEDNVVDGRKIATISNAGKLTTKTVTKPCVIKVKATVKATGTSDIKEITLYPATKTITITGAPKTIKYQAGLTYPLSATVQPADADVWALKWSSSNPKIADVDPDTGELEILDAGKVRIECKTTDGSNVKGYLYLEITKDAKSVKITAPAKTLASGESMNLKAVVYSNKNVKAANQQVTWSIADAYGNATSAATISATGRVMAREVDQNTVVVVTATSAEDADVNSSVELTIKPNTKKTLHVYADGALVNGTYPMNLNDSCVLDGMWQKSANGTFVEAKDCTFFSSNTKVATVDEELGVLTAVGYGSSTITVRCVDPQTDNLYTTTITVKVMKLVGSVTISAPDNKNLRSGSSARLSATAWTDYANGVKADNQSFTWEVKEVISGTSGETLKDTDIASISSSGVLTAGTVTEERTVEVKAISKENGISAAVRFKLYPKDECKLIFKLDGEEYANILPVDLDEGLDGLTVEAITAIAKDGAITADITDVTSAVTWTSDNKNVIEVGAGGKGLTVKAVGKAKLTAKFYLNSNKKTYQASITAVVNQTMGSVTIEQSSILVSGKYTYMRAIPTNTNATNKNVLWSVEDVPGATESVVDQVSINAYTGKLSAKRGITEQIEIVVKADPVDGSPEATETVIVYPLTTKVEIYDGADVVNGTTVLVSLSEETAIFYATASPTDAYDDSFKWTSSNTGIAEVDEEGNVTLKNTGAVTIKATAMDGSGKYAKFKLRITK